MTVASWIDAALAATQADDCSVVVTEVHQLNLRWAATALTTNGRSSERRADVVSYRGDAFGTASGSVSSEADLLALVAAADAASLDAPANDAVLPLPEGTREEDFETDAEVIEVEAFATLTHDLGQAFARAQAEGHLLYGFAEYMRSTVWLGTTTGVRRRVVEPWGRFEFTAKMPDMVNSAYVGQQTNDFTDVDVAAHHAELMRRLEWGRTRIELPAGRYETILSPSAVVDLMYPVTWEISHKDAAEGSTVFAGKDGGTRIGERFSDLPFTYITDPRAERFPTVPFVATGSNVPGRVSVYDNGADIERIEWFREGVLTNLAAPRVDMAALGVVGPVRQDAENMLLDAGGTATIEDMIASTERGLLVTCLWYIRTVDPQTLLLTGLTRDGVYLIEDGEVKGLVNNFRWNESPLDLMRRCTEVSRAEHTLCREWNDWFIRSEAPAMRVPDFCMSTVSQAV